MKGRRAKIVLIVIFSLLLVAVGTLTVISICRGVSTDLTAHALQWQGQGTRQNGYILPLTSFHTWTFGGSLSLATQGLSYLSIRPDEYSGNVFIESALFGSKTYRFPIFADKIVSVAQAQPDYAQLSITFGNVQNTNRLGVKGDFGEYTAFADSEPLFGQGFMYDLSDSANVIWWTSQANDGYVDPQGLARDLCQWTGTIDLFFDNDIQLSDFTYMQPNKAEDPYPKIAIGNDGYQNCTFEWTNEYDPLQFYFKQGFAIFNQQTNAQIGSGFITFTCLSLTGVETIQKADRSFIIPPTGYLVKPATPLILPNSAFNFTPSDYNLGYSTGYSEGRSNGYNSGVDAGYRQGFEAAQQTGGTAVGGALGVARSVFQSVYDIINVPIFGEYFTVGTILSIIVMLGLVMLVIKLIRG